jgi:hypothetical protein
MTDFTYKVGPLVFSSNMQLPYAAVPAHLSTASILLVDELPKSPPPQGNHLHEIWSERGVWLFSGGIPRALVRSERSAHIGRVDNTDSFAGVVAIALRTMLMLSGVVLLHGSAVAKNGRAWMWFGQSGSGKSTTAAREALGGALHLGDDVVPLCFNELGEVCTFQCDRVASLEHQPNGEVHGIDFSKLPLKADRIREDGKCLYQVSSASSELYPVERLEHLAERGIPSGIEISSSECIRLLLQSVGGRKLTPDASPRRPLTIVAALVQQLTRDFSADNAPRGQEEDMRKDIGA